MTLIILIAAGGALGALLRYVVLSLSPSRALWMLAVINLLGSAVAGGLAALPGSTLNAALILGACGGFTTFSTLALHLVTLAQEHRFTRAVMVAALHGVGSGVLATLAFGLTSALS